MRYSSEHKAATRERLLKSAGALAKEKGFGTTGVDALMAAAGLTAGAFYAHFDSKAEMLQALIERELGRSMAMLTKASGEMFVAGLRRYLSVGHVEHPERGCALPALTAEVARADEGVRGTFEQIVLQIKDRMRAQLTSDDEAWSMLAQLVGAVMIARAMRSSAAREAVLDGVHRQIAKMVETKAPAP